MESTITKVDWWQPIVYVASYHWASYVVYPNEEPEPGTFSLRTNAWGGEYTWKA